MSNEVGPPQIVYIRPMPNNLKIAAAVHVYYENMWPELATCLRNLPNDTDIFVTIPDFSSTDQLILADFPSAKVIRVPNVGRDIAPFVALLPELLKFDVVCKMHTKRDISGKGEWRKAILEGVAGSRRIVSSIIFAFEHNPDLVLAGAGRFYFDGPRNIYGNQTLLEKYEIKLPEQYGFFAGSVFWVRPSLLADFFGQVSPGDFISHRDVDGHLEHAIERLIGACAAINGGKVALARKGWFGWSRLSVVLADRPQNIIKISIHKVFNLIGFSISRTSPFIKRIKRVKRIYAFRSNSGADAVLSPSLRETKTLISGGSDPNGELFRKWAEIPGGHKWLHYFPIYERVFGQLREKPGRFLEIGVFRGGSLKMWREYFHPETVIVGIDIDPTCQQFDDPDKNVHVRIGSQGDEAFLQSVVNEFGPFDSVLDDGSHQTGHLIATFNAIFDWGMVENGVYVAEDLHTNYWPGFRTGPVSFVDLMKHLVDVMHTPYHSAHSDLYFQEGHPYRINSMDVPRIATLIDSIEFLDSVAVIRRSHKKALPVVSLLN